jgi:hypothetical protein
MVLRVRYSYSCGHHSDNGVAAVPLTACITTFSSQYCLMNLMADRELEWYRGLPQYIMLEYFQKYFKAMVFDLCRSFTQWQISHEQKVASHCPAVYWPPSHLAYIFIPDVRFEFNKFCHQRLALGEVWRDGLTNDVTEPWH